MKRNLKVSIPNRTPMAYLSCLAMSAAAVLRLIYYLTRDIPLLQLWIYFVLPEVAAGLFLVGMILGGRFTKPAMLTAVVLGVAFFILKATTFTLVHQILCTILYSAVLILVFATVQGWLPTKRLLYPLFGLPMLFHLLVEDPHKYFFAQPPVPVVEWLPEISVLCIMASLFSLSVAMRTQRIASDQA